MESQTYAVRYEIAIDPANASFYVTENGAPVARFGDHHKATSFVLAAQGLTEARRQQEDK